MAAIGGSVTECSIRGRIMSPDGEAQVKINLGGWNNEVKPNGDATARLIKKRVPCGIEGLVVALDHTNADLSFLQEVADGKEFVAVTVTLASGDTFAGDMQIVDGVNGDTMAASVELKLAGTGVIEQQ